MRIFGWDGGGRKRGGPMGEGRGAARGEEKSWVADQEPNLEKKGGTTARQANARRAGSKKKRKKRKITTEKWKEEEGEKRGM